VPVLNVNETAFWIVAVTVMVGAMVATFVFCVVAKVVGAIVNRAAKMASVVRFICVLFNVPVATHFFH
jgi:hypothetical protein